MRYNKIHEGSHSSSYRMTLQSATEAPKVVGTSIVVGWISWSARGFPCWAECWVCSPSPALSWPWGVSSSLVLLMHMLHLLLGVSLPPWFFWCTCSIFFLNNLKTIECDSCIKNLKTFLSLNRRWWGKKPRGRKRSGTAPEGSPWGILPAKDYATVRSPLAALLRVTMIGL